MVKQANSACAMRSVRFVRSGEGGRRARARGDRIDGWMTTMRVNGGKF